MELDEIPKSVRTDAMVALFITRCAEVAALQVGRNKVAKYASLRSRSLRKGLSDEARLSTAFAVAKLDCDYVDQHRLYSDSRGHGRARLSAQRLARDMLHEYTGWGMVEWATRYLVSVVYEDGWARVSSKLASTNDRGPLFVREMREVSERSNAVLDSLISECFFDAPPDPSTLPKPSAWLAYASLAVSALAACKKGKHWE